MSNALGAECLKLRTTPTLLWTAVALIATVSVADIIHVAGFNTDLVNEREEQLSILLDVGVGLGLVFAAVTGALAMTSEYRYGTIRSTLLRLPRRDLTLAAKTATQLLVGAVLGFAATAYAVGLAAVILGLRGIELRLEPSDVATLIGGGAVGGALFALVGLGIGTVARSQVPVVVGILIWTLFIESLLRAGVPTVGKYTPGSLARTLAGETTAALSPAAAAGAALAALVLAGMVGAATTLRRRDIP